MGIKKETIGSALKKGARIVPGIGSYQDRESLREGDKELRKRLCLHLEGHIQAIDRLKSSRAKKGEFRQLDELEGLSRQLEKVSRLLETASRGYAPLFSDVAVDEDVLRKLHEYDAGFWEWFSILDNAVHSILADQAITKSEEISHVRSLLDSIETRFKKREDVVKNRG